MAWAVLESGVSEDRFLCLEPESSGVEGSSLSLYQLPTDAASLPKLLSKSSLPVVRCLDWHPSNESVLATGHPSGSVSLCAALSLSAQQPLELPSPKHPRACLCLSFSQSHPHWLAAGYERHRTEKGLIVWDLADALGPDSKGVPTYTPPVANHSDSHLAATASGSLRRRRGADSIGVVGRAAWELAAGEAVASLLWLRQANRTLALGLSGRYIRLVDLRADPSKYQLSVSTKAVNGLRQSPWQEQQFLSHAEGQLLVWDLRSGKADKPLLSVAENKPIAHASWDSLRSEAFSVLCANSTCVGTYSIQRAVGEEAELAATDRHFRPLFPRYSKDDSNKEVVEWDSEVVTGFAWHSRKASTLIALSASGALSCQEVHERLCLDWGPTDALAVSFGAQLYAAEGLCLPPEHEDISLRMRRRALSGGLGRASGGEEESSSGAPDSELFDPSRWVWEWTDRVKAAGLSPSKAGLEALINSASKESVAEFNSMATEAVLRSAPPLQMYRSKERGLIRRLAGWESLGGGSARWALAALVQLELKSAVDALLRLGSDGGDSEASLTAMAVAGWPGTSDAGAGQWSSATQTLLPSLTQPHLRAAILFLRGLSATDSTPHKALMQESNLPVMDLAAIGSLHLSDSDLLDWAEKASEAAIAKGDLTGLCLTGLSAQGGSRNLIQAYLDETGDVQTSALLLVHSGTLSRGKKEEEPILMAYLELLKAWGLWHVRVQTEALLPIAASAPPLPPHVSLSCTFCGKSLSTKASRHRIAAPGGQKLSVCPHCRKPLPRCSVCRRHMGGPLPRGEDIEEEAAAKAQQQQRSHRLGGWMAWCQSCRHGGHAAHLAAWFAQAQECPVVGCPCRCGLLDRTDPSPPSPISPKQSRHPSSHH